MSPKRLHLRLYSAGWMIRHVKPANHLSMCGQEAIPMAQNVQIARRQVGVSNVLGLHLRVADQFVRAAKAFRSDVRVHCEGAMADGKSILSLLSLAAECGAMLAIEAEGCDAEDAVGVLAGLISGWSSEPEDRGREAGDESVERHQSMAPAWAGSPHGAPSI
jgi:phosphocarrier protein